MAYPVGSVDESKAILHRLKSDHPKSSHCCYAYIIGEEGETQKIWDDGEPSGTAGLPILHQIKSFGCTYTLVAVIRYYGGKQLGASGLKNAYKTSAKSALEQNQIIEKYPTICLLLESSYAQMPHVMNTLKKFPVEILNQKINNLCYWKVRIPKKEESIIKNNLSNFCTFTSC